MEEINHGSFNGFSDFLSNLINENVKAWEILAGQYAHQVRLNLVRVGVNPQAVDDCLQKTYEELLEVFRKRKKSEADFATPHALVRYLYFISYHKYVDGHRARFPALQWHEHFEDEALCLEDIIVHFLDEEHQASLKQRYDRMVNDLIRLTKSEKDKLILRKYFLDFEDMKTVMACCEKKEEEKVKKMIQRAKEKLRKRIQEEASR